MPLADYQAEIREEKRTALLDAARAAFLARGFARSSVNAIAEDAGVSIATLYKHFGTKEDLFGAVVGRMWTELRGRLDLAQLGTLAPADALYLIGNEYAEFLGRAGVKELFRVIIAEAEQFPELGEKLYEHGKEAYLEKLGCYLEERVDADELNVDDVTLAKRQFLGMINDAVFWPKLLLVEHEMSREACEEIVRGAVTTFLARYGEKRSP